MDEPGPPGDTGAGGAAHRDERADDLAAERAARVAYARRSARRHRRYAEIAGVVTFALLLGFIFDGFLLPWASPPVETTQPVATPRPAQTTEPNQMTFTFSVTATAQGVWRSTSAHCGLELCSVIERLEPDGRHWRRLTAVQADTSTRAIAESVAPGALITMAPDGINGWAGGLPTGYRTHDGGRGWRPLPLPSLSAPAADPVHGVAVSVLSYDVGTVYAAPLGTDRWEQITTPSGWRGTERVVIAAGVWGFPAVDDDGASLLASTADAGATWHQGTLPCAAGRVRDVAGGPHSFWVQCAGRGTGAAVYRSTDAGDTWTRAFASTGSIVTFTPVTDDDVLVSTAGSLALHHVGGASRPVQIALSDDQADRISMIDRSAGYLSTVHGYVYRTGDGGLTWDRLPG